MSVFSRNKRGCELVIFGHIGLYQAGVEMLHLDVVLLKFSIERFGEESHVCLWEEVLVQVKHREI